MAARAGKELELNPEHWILAQGTIYPDTIESGGTKHADKIKTHHNRVEGIQALIVAGKLLEPIKDLYKDEVRELGLQLGLPEEMIFRHPFPGPGLGVRALCADSSVQATKLKDQDLAALQELVADECPVTILPIKSVGVQGDARSYAHPALLSPSDLDWKSLEKLSVKITNNIRSINRVIVKLTGDASELNLISASLTKDRLDLLRKADKLFTETLIEAGLYHEVWQAPVVLIPLKNKQGETIVLRPINSTEAMTANFSKLPTDFVKEVAGKILAIDGIGLVAYDITNKPPGTIEWE